MIIVQFQAENGILYIEPFNNAQESIKRFYINGYIVSNETFENVVRAVEKYCSNNSGMEFVDCVRKTDYVTTKLC